MEEVKRKGLLSLYLEDLEETGLQNVLNASTESNKMIHKWIQSFYSPLTFRICQRVWYLDPVPVLGVFLAQIPLSFTQHFIFWTHLPLNSQCQKAALNIII